MKSKPVYFSVLLIILLILIAGCTSHSSAPSSSGNSLVGGGQTTNLNNGDTAILSSNGFKESVRVYYDRPSGEIEMNLTNLGDRALTDSEPSKIYAVDWGKVTYGKGDWYIEDIRGTIIYPGESYFNKLKLDDLIGNNNTKAKKGDITLYVTFGDAEGSWIIPPS